MMENLAPAGSRESLERAVAAGADAVYLGCTVFSARAGAGNFTPEELRDAVRLCHLHGVKVHVTVNTLIKDSELDAVTDLLRLLADTRVDAVLVQDLGVLRILRKRFPGLPVHASTQMSLHNAAGAKWAAAHGVTRVVLARECPLSEIRLAADSGIEIEVFGHGAQCVSVSGQCLFSSMAGGRSGNRGRCAQPCRMLYQCRGELGAWLSPRDVCLRDDLPALADAGACSVKIEGRLKRPEYVSVVTASYRKGLDSLYSGRFEPAGEEEKRGLLQIFNRGGFMRGRAMGCEDAAFIDPERVNHGGVEIGTVERADARFAHLRVRLPLHDGDQLRIGTDRGDYETLYAGNEVPAGGTATLRLREDSRVRPGDRVVRMTDSEQMKAAMEIPMPGIPVDFALTAAAGQPLSLTVTAKGVSVTVAGDPVATAEKNPLTPERAEQQLRKTGGTDFEAADCTVKTENAFVPASALNALRREALEKLADAICAAAAPEKAEEGPDDACVLPSGGLPDAVIVHRLEQLRDLPENALPVWEPEDWRPDALEREIEGFPGDIWLQLPTVCEEKTLQSIAGFVKDHSNRIHGVVLGSVGQLGIPWPVPFAAGAGIPVMNRRAAQFLFEAGCRFVTASPELNRQELRTLMAGDPPIAVPSYGREQLMLFYHCPARTRLGLKEGHAACRLCDRESPDSLRGMTLTDRQNMAFPLRRVRLPEGCRIRLLNAKITDIRREVKALGWPQLIRLDDEGSADPPAVREDMRTSGHWRRGVE